MRFEERKIGELIINFDSRRIPLSSRERAKRKGSYPYYGATGIFDYVNDYLFDGVYILLGEDGTVINSDGTPVLQIAKGKFWVNNHAHILQNTDLVDFDFLYYLLKNTNFRSAVTGAVQPKISQTNLNAIKVTIPSNKSDQRKIARVLKSVDKKIANNNAINNNLQAQAEALFADAIASCTEFEKLGSFADVKGGKRLPKGVNLISAPNSHPYIRVRDLNDTLIVQLNNAFEYVDDDTQRGIARYTVSDGDVLLSIVGTIGLSAIVDKSLANANLTENCVKVTNLKIVSAEYILLYLRSANGQSQIAKNTVGAVQAKLPLKNIQAIDVPIIDAVRRESLQKSLSTIFNTISHNLSESYRLATLRDTLLPKLMSGEIDVSDVEI